MILGSGKLSCPHEHKILKIKETLVVKKKKKKKNKDETHVIPGHQCWRSFDAKTTFPGAKARLACCMCAHLCVCVLPWRNLSLICLISFAQTRYKTVLKNQASLEQLLR